MTEGVFYKRISTLHPYRLTARAISSKADGVRHSATNTKSRTLQPYSARLWVDRSIPQQLLEDGGDGLGKDLVALGGEVTAVGGVGVVNLARFGVHQG